MANVDGGATGEAGAPIVVSGIGKLAEALAKAQAEFTTVPKTKTATIKSDRGSYTYTYADLADIMGMALPRLAKHGLAFIQRLRRFDHKLYLTSELLHASGERLSSDGMEISELGTDPRVLGIKLSYFRRYDASSFLAIVADDDLDIPDGAEPGAVTDKGVAGLRKPVVGLTEKAAEGGRQEAGKAKEATVSKPINELPVSPSDNPAPNPFVAVGAESKNAPQAAAITPPEDKKPEEPKTKEMFERVATVLKEKYPKNPNQVLRDMIAATYGKARFEDVPKEEQPKAVRVYYHMLQEKGKEAILDAAAALTAKPKA